VIRSLLIRALGIAGLAALAAAIVLAVLALGVLFAAAFALTVTTAALSVTLGVVFTRKVLTVSRRRARCGAEGLVGYVGVVRRPLDPVGHVAIDGELWRARRCWGEEDEPAPREGDPVIVNEVLGLTLSVRRAEVWELEP
jgi:membrane protein implicated in regulation of membrane protease activity